MGRTVTAWVTVGGDFLGAVGPFPVDVPWWSEVEPVVGHLGRVLGVPVLVLRLVAVDGGRGAGEGHVTYHVEALGRPVAGVLGRVPVDDEVLFGSEPLRAPWADAAGVREALGWAADALAAVGRPVSGPVVQRKTWNLAGLFRFPTVGGPVWLKTTPHFAGDEARAIGALAEVDPGLVPAVVAAAPGRVLLEHVPGEDCWHAPDPVVASAVDRMVDAQAALAGRADGLRDLRGPVIARHVRELLDGALAAELTAAELAEARGLLDRWSIVDDCGLPDTLVHGDFHPGNWRSAGGPPVVVDFADVHFGHPVLDGLRVCDFLPEARRPVATRAWIDAWRRRRPGSDPGRALAVAGPLAQLYYAVRYQEFLDGIEPSERIYHRGDPVDCVRTALRLARTESARG